MIPNKEIEVDGARLDALLNDPETAEVRYLRAFSRPDRVRNFDALCELLSEVTNLTEEEIDTMTVPEVQEMMGRITEAINQQAVNPPKAVGSSPTATEQPKPSPAGGAAS